MRHSAPAAHAILGTWCPSGTRGPSLLAASGAKLDATMSFPSKAIVRTLVCLALASGARSQAPAHAPLQTPTRVTVPPADDDFSALLGRAAAGDAQAQYALGNYYFRGRSLTLEHAEALAWYRKAAEQGYAPAENLLGTLYQHGFGVVRNFKLALAYYRKAADQGYAPAEFNLGVTYESGNYGVKRDYQQAFAWYRKAADQNWSDGEREVAYFYQCGFAVKQDLAEALAWYRRSAGHGNAMAENQLGYFAEEGWGEPKNYNEALSWYYKAAEHGNDTAAENIGYLFQNGVGVATDYAKALYWYYKAAAQGNADAENQLGWMYQYGQGVKQDNANALAWYGLAADQGNVHGRNNLQAFCDELDRRGDEECETGSSPITDAAIAQAQRRARMSDLRARIDGLEGDAQEQEDQAYELEHTGKGKKDAITKVFNAIGSVPAAKFRLQAENDRASAARLRDELRQLESQDQLNAGVPEP